MTRGEDDLACYLRVDYEVRLAATVGYGESEWERSESPRPGATGGGSTRRRGGPVRPGGRRWAWLSEAARLQSELQALAVQSERERIAREMHDGLAQVLGYVNTKSQAVEEMLVAGRVEDARRLLASWLPPLDPCTWTCARLSSASPPRSRRNGGVAARPGGVTRPFTRNRRSSR